MWPPPDTLSDNGGYLGVDDPIEIRTFISDGNGGYVWDHKTTLSSDGETRRYTANAIFVDVSAGLDHSLLVDSEGNVWAAGNNDHGQLGLDTSVRSMPYFVKVIDTGLQNGVAVLSDLTLVGKDDLVGLGAVLLQDDDGHKPGLAGETV